MRKVEFNLSSNLVLQISESNYMSADQLIDQLMSYDGFTLKKNNVKRSVANLLYENHEIKKAYYDCLTGKVTLILDENEWVDLHDIGITIFKYTENELKSYGNDGYIVEMCERSRIKEAYNRLKSSEYDYDILVGYTTEDNYFIMYKPMMWS